ncbi:chloroplastic PPL1 PsbP-like protein 1 [Klebsormidium nitens]|uniref:Chloroplastic PPL1 PsbP-like protein 1 n=1 Tax=Klebsormidium nitens TaxID=105231 RepID=A0A1Y1IM53_KLENI|nr:chloroplastic PPL1 PsbP-like protein 1 [Klebsormidium nitens]|eukprot:GAQ89198.1 chloroplastic PPL1 PsbP-like protein 1 [Klebsormidium nitens]
MQSCTVVGAAAPQVAACLGQHRLAKSGAQHQFAAKIHPQFSKSVSKPSSTSKRACVVASSDETTAAPSTTRREILLGAATALSLAALPAQAANAPAGFKVSEDASEGFKFLYPFGWEEVSVKGQKVVYKDVIEPLESVSVTVIGTEKEKLSEIGSPQEVAQNLIDQVLTSPTQEPKLLSVNEKSDGNGKTYYQFEYTAKSRNFTRHALTTVGISRGKFYTLTTGANERRWNKVNNKLRTVVDSFSLAY